MLPAFDVAFLITDYFLTLNTKLQLIEVNCPNLGRFLAKIILRFVNRPGDFAITKNSPDYGLVTKSSD